MTVASGTFKYVVPRLTCHHEGAAQVMTFQPRDNIFECSTSKRASSVLSYDQLRASTTIIEIWLVLISHITEGRRLTSSFFSKKFRSKMKSTIVCKEISQCNLPILWVSKPQLLNRWLCGITEPLKCWSFWRNLWSLSQNKTKSILNSRQALMSERASVTVRHEYVLNHLQSHFHSEPSRNADSEPTTNQVIPFSSTILQFPSLT